MIHRIFSTLPKIQHANRPLDVRMVAVLFRINLQKNSTMHNLLVLFAALISAHAWSANKCTAPDGSVSFQDAPCTVGAKRSESLDLPQAAQVSELESRINTALASGKVITGMTSAQAKRAWGSPSKINSSVGRYGRNEQWVYERPNYRNYYLYMENGILTSFQTSE